MESPTDGRAFLRSSRLLLNTPSEENRRSAAGRAYYALMHEGRASLSRWGFPVLPRENVHTFVRLRFAYPADPDLKRVGDALEALGLLRNQADYKLSFPGRFASDRDALWARNLAQDAIDLLDALAADPARRAAAIAAIRAAWP